MENLLPKAVYPYAKAWVAFLGFLGTTVATTWGDAPDWVGVVGGILTTVGVYLTPNAEVDA